MLFVRRDLAAAYVVVAGLATGIVAALISAPISANVFGGVTGGGTDFLVAALRQAGADIGAATLGQGLISDPIDKITTFFVVYLILSAMARRMIARFPQGEYLLEQTERAGGRGGRVAGSARLSDAGPATERGVPDFLGRPGPSAVHRLNPLTKATLATVTAIAAVVLGGLIGPVVLVAVAVILPGARGRRASVSWLG